MRLIKRRILIILYINIILFCCACVFENQDNVNKKSEQDIIIDKIVQTNVPTAYQTVLKEYQMILELRFSDSFFEKYEKGMSINLSKKLQQDLEKDVINVMGEKQKLGIHFYNMLVEMDSLLGGGGAPEDFGYIIKDINQDSIDELFWVDKNHNILAMFTIREGQAELLDAFWPRYRAVLLNDSNLYIRSSSGADFTYWQIKELASNSTGFAEIETFGTYRVEQSHNEQIYFCITDNHQENINVNKLNKLLKKYPFEHSEAWLNTQITFFE